MTTESQDSAREEVRRVIDDRRATATGYTIDDIKTGGWFVRFLHHCIETYSEKVNAEYFKEKYPGLPPDAVVARQIDLAETYAAI